MENFDKLAIRHRMCYFHETSDLGKEDHGKSDGIVHFMF